MADHETLHGVRPNKALETGAVPAVWVQRRGFRSGDVIRWSSGQLDLVAEREQRQNRKNPEKSKRQKG